MSGFVGREKEAGILQAALTTDRSELIVVYGRRRVGKTFLVREVYKKHIFFEFSGMYKASLKDQLKNFHLTLSDKYPDTKQPDDWTEAFRILGQCLTKSRSRKKKVVFIDEFPWLDTRRSKFLAAFGYFWNSFAGKRNDLVVVLCGSAASYMIQNIIKSKGGLHNRLTHRIRLLPFTLNETEQLLKRNHIKLSRYDILQLYMAIGGIPHYLERIETGESVAQAIDRLCFQKDGFLRAEFNNVFASLFDFYDNHEAIVRSLAKVRKGLTRNEILNASKITSGGTLSKTLEELEESGFIEKYTPYRGVKDSVYRLADEYSMFYLKFIEKTKPSNNAIWQKIQGQQAYKIWSGFSFETICMKHIEQIKEGLKIAGVHTEHGSWIDKKGERGVQIDLLIDRADQVVNLCEMKFYNTEFVLDKKYAMEIAQKVNIFSEATKTKKSVFVTFITTYGLKQNQYSKQFVQNDLTMDALFLNL